MKRLLAYLFLVLVLIFSLQSWTKADDISDFEIEGMGVGDSLYDFFDKKKINNSIVDWYDDLEKYKYISFAFDSNKFETYDFVDIWTKYDDKQFKIYAIAGVNYFGQNKEIKDIKDCYSQQKDIANSLMQLFPGAEKKGPYKNIFYSADPTGKSTYTDIYLDLNINNYEVVIGCYDWNKDLKNKVDHLYIAIRTLVFSKWLN